MNPPDDDLQEAARLWAVRVQDRSFDRWDELAVWLEADARHLSAYEAAVDVEDWATEVLEGTPAPAGSIQPQPRSRRWAIPAGIAAAVFAAIGGWLLVFANAMTEITTGAGEQRTVHLSDGSVVTLNGSSRIRFDPESPRLVTLVEGEALFDVHHDDTVPFTVMAGETRLVDIGTVFNVVQTSDALDVAVAHGAVLVEPGAGEVRLDAGQALLRERDARPVLRQVSTGSVGGWQSGRLQYDNAPLDHVARDIARTTGLAIRPDDRLGKMRFTGTVYVRGSASDMLTRVGPLLGVKFAREGNGWTMTADHGPSP